MRFSSPLSRSYGPINAFLRRTRSARLSQSRTILQHIQPRSSTRTQPTSPTATTAATLEESHLPRIAQPSIWNSIIPRFLRPQGNPLKGIFSREANQTTKKPHNPATFFIWIYILIGSQAIRILGTKNEFANYKRQADLKLEKLREVIEKLQRGEDVDVEKVLGTGDEVQELEWEQALREIEDEDRAWQRSRENKRKERERLLREQEDANPISDHASSEKTTSNEVEMDPSAADQTRPQTVGFY